MNKLLAFFKIIRPVNLAIIALTMYAIRFLIIKPYLAIDGNMILELQLSHLDFFLLVLSVILIAAGGNVINDANDINTDRVNNPNKLKYVTLFSQNALSTIHIILNIIGIGLGIYLANEIGVIQLMGIHIFASASLWFYSTNFKQGFLSGNLIIALLAALVPMTVALFEIPPVIDQYGNLMVNHFQSRGKEYGYLAELFFYIPLYWSFGFGLFAFLTTLSREIQKDMADIEGDKLVDYTTLPIRWGIQKAKRFVLAINALTIAALFYFQVNYLSDRGTFVYFLVISIFILLNTFHLWKSEERKDFVRAGTIMKLTMLIGISYSLYVYYMFTGFDIQ